MNGLGSFRDTDVPPLDSLPMAMLITDPDLEEQLQAQRAATGADRYDVVWKGIYMISPMSNDEHQAIVASFTGILLETVGWMGEGQVRPGVNVSDRTDDWRQNYRVPDVAVFLNDTRAVNRDTHWFGGPDFVVEIVSPDDRSREKLDFYGKVSVGELLLIDRAPWKLELYRLQGEALKLAGECSSVEDPSLASTRVPLTFRLLPSQQRPQIEVTHTESGRVWLV